LTARAFSPVGSCLDRRRRATETVGDLPDREPLELTVMVRQGDRPATLENAIGTRA
jgi:hypothetical protein